MLIVFYEFAQNPGFAMPTAGSEQLAAGPPLQWTPGGSDEASFVCVTYPALDLEG